PGIGQKGDETGESATGLAYGNFSEVCPVDLALLSGEGLQAEERFTRGRTQSGYHAPELSGAAGVTTLDQHLVDAGCAQARILIQDFPDEGQVGVGDGGTQGAGAGSAKTIGFKSVAHSVGMDL